MAQKEGWRLLSKRNILGAVLAAGIAVGLYLGDIWKGLGGGNSIGVGVGDSSSHSTGDGSGDGHAEPNKHLNVEATEEAPADGSVAAPALPASPVTHVLKIVIADRSYFVRSPEGDQPAELKDVVRQAKAATGDEDGIRVRVYRKLTSRPAVEIALNDALIAAGLNEDQIVWVANPID